MIQSEDQYYIKEIEVYVSRQGNGIVDERHLKTENAFGYYKIDGVEKRYVICNQWGICGTPARIYEGALQDECFFASGICKPTRRYIRKLDNTYFKFYDDAEEVLNNITRFIKWLKQVPNLALKPAQKKRIVNVNLHLILGVPDFPELKLTQDLNSTLKLRRRSELKGLALYNQNELDLVPEKD